MAPTLLFDPESTDRSKVQLDVEAIEAINPHRGAMRMLDGVWWMAADCSRAHAFKRVRDDEFWVPGHIPGRPLLPGVLMIEAAAQVASIMYTSRPDSPGGFMGFVAVEKVRFRGQVKPGDVLEILGEVTQYKPRRCISVAQGVVDGRLVFEGVVTGMPI